MSEQPSDVPQYKMVDGELVELTQAEIDAIMAERAALAADAEQQPAGAPTPTTEKPHGGRRAK
jgi:hypothetical protein